jgi:hypothetical protein
VSSDDKVSARLDPHLLDMIHVVQNLYNSKHDLLSYKIEAHRRRGLMSSSDGEINWQLRIVSHYSYGFKPRQLTEILQETNKLNLTIAVNSAGDLILR